MMNSKGGCITWRIYGEGCITLVNNTKEWDYVTLMRKIYGEEHTKICITQNRRERGLYNIAMENTTEVFTALWKT